MLLLAGAFAARGLDVDLVLARSMGEYLSKVPERVRLVDLQVPRLRATPPHLASYLRRERPAALLSAYDHLNILPVAARVLSGVRTRLVCTVHINLSTHLKLTQPGVRSRAYARLLRAAFHSADHTVCVSQGVADDVVTNLGVSPERVSVIYNPVLLDRVRELAEEPVDHPWFQPGGPPVILGMGRLDAQKDFPSLLRAFSIVRQKKAAKLAILGEGNERAQLEQLVEDLKIDGDVWLPGFVENPYRYLKRAAVFAMSSRWEGLPLVLIEALALGVSVVSTDCPSGPREVLENGRWGRLVPMGDSAALADAIGNALDKPIVAPPAALERFDMEQVVSQYLNVLGLEPC